MGTFIEIQRRQNLLQVQPSAITNEQLLYRSLKIVERTEFSMIVMKRTVEDLHKQHNRTCLCHANITTIQVTSILAY